MIHAHFGEWGEGEHMYRAWQGKIEGKKSIIIMKTYIPFNLIINFQEYTKSCVIRVWIRDAILVKETHI